MLGWHDVILHRAGVIRSLQSFEQELVRQQLVASNMRRGGAVTRGGVRLDCVRGWCRAENTDEVCVETRRRQHGSPVSPAVFQVICLVILNHWRDI
jgi:hypothetical protein